MKKLFLFLLLAPAIAFGQDVNKNREMMMQTNNFKNFSPKGGGSRVKASPFLTSSDFTFLSNPTFEGGYRQSLSLGFGKTTANGLIGYGGNGFSTLDGTQKGVSLLVSRKNSNFSVSFTEIAESRSKSISYLKFVRGQKWTSGFGLNYSMTKTQIVTNLPPQETSAPSMMVFTTRDFPLSKRFIFTPEILLNQSFGYFSKGEWTGDPTFNAFVGSGIGWKVSKKFLLVGAYRGNINTNPKFGLMHNFLIGNRFDLK